MLRGWTEGPLDAEPQHSTVQRDTGIICVAAARGRTDENLLWASGKLSRIEPATDATPNALRTISERLRSPHLGGDNAKNCRRAKDFSEA